MEARTVTTDQESFAQSFRTGWAIVRSHNYAGRGPNGQDVYASGLRAGISAAKAGVLARPQTETIHRAFVEWERKVVAQNKAADAARMAEGR